MEKLNMFLCILTALTLLQYTNGFVNLEKSANLSSTPVVPITSDVTNATSVAPITSDVTNATSVAPITSDVTNATSVVTDTTDVTMLPLQNATDVSSDIPQYWGFITAGIAVLFYGSNFAPVKKFETGDGMFFQWILCSAVLVVGIVIQVIRGTKNFYPIVMLGGFIWETGNICVVPIIKTIGMGLGLCIWGMTALLSGWATGRFGFFGLQATNFSDDTKSTLNIIGVVIATFSCIVFAFVKNDISPIEDISQTEPLLNDSSSRQNYGTQDNESLYNASTNTHDALLFNQRQRNASINRNDDITDEIFIDRLSPGKKRILGMGLSVFSGLLYAHIFTPAIYMQQRDGQSKNALDYVFACFCGIYLTSTVYFVIYIIFMKNKPRIYPQCILPGLVSGLMWGVATACWFVANEVLSEAVAFPIISTGPSIVASVWGVFVFHEIKGGKNISILLLGFVFVITGAVLTGLSRS